MTDLRPFRDLYPFESHYFATSGGRIHYLDEGQKDAPALVMVHGNPTWSFFFRDLVKTLSDRFRVIAVDHMGCGLSDKPQKYGYRLEQHIDNLEALVQHLGLSRLTLMLHDWGGAIGMGYAVRNPASVSQFVLFNTAAFPAKRMPLSIAACRWPALGAVLIRGFNAFSRGALRFCVKKRLSPSVAAGYLAPYNNWANRIAQHRFVQDIPMNARHPSYEVLSQISEGLAQFSSKPMLLVWGGADFVFNRKFYDEWRRRFPDAESHYLEHAGHYLLEDAVEDVLPYVDAFLGRPQSMEAN